MTRNADHLTTVHELSHALEHHEQKIHDQAVAFLRRRAGSDPLERLADIRPGWGYARSERAWRDQFRNPYAGKHYQDSRATEIISMGFEEMARDPLGFAATDPEYFDMIYRVIWNL